MKTKENDLGQTEAETTFVVKRAAVHKLAGWTMHEAIGLALRDLVAFYTEMAQAKTPRSKAAVKALIARIHSEINNEGT
jgi:hypothetical protein